MIDRAAAIAGLRQAVSDAVDWLDARLADEAKAAVPPTEDYAMVRADLLERLTDAFLSFVSSSPGTRHKNAARRAVAEAIPAAFYSGYVDAGGEETEADDEKWLTAEQGRQLDFLIDTFEALKDDRENETATEDALRGRAETWARTLDGIYAEGKLRGKDNVMLTFDGDDGEESCRECQKYKGKRHSAKWWLKRDLVRRNGNEHYTCGRWGNCHHGFYTDDGTLYAE